MEKHVVRTAVHQTAQVNDISNWRGFLLIVPLGGFSRLGFVRRLYRICGSGVLLSRDFTYE